MIHLLTLNWNTTNMLIRLYESAKNNSKNKFSMIIVDNGSDSFEKFTLDSYSNFDNLSITFNEQNEGFSKGNNIGLMSRKFNDDDIIIFVNSDIIINEKNWDEKFEKVFCDQSIGIIGCSYHPLEWTKNGDFKIKPLPTTLTQSETVQGAFFATKWKILKKLYENDKCYFDENFKMAQYEDTDLCIRIMKLGYKCMFMPLNHVHDHHHSATKKNGYKLNSEINDINVFKNNAQRNKQLLLKKHTDWFCSKN